MGFNLTHFTPSVCHAPCLRISRGRQEQKHDGRRPGRGPGQAGGQGWFQSQPGQGWGVNGSLSSGNPWRIPCKASRRQQQGRCTTGRGAWGGCWWFWLQGHSGDHRPSSRKRGERQGCGPWLQLQCGWGAKGPPMPSRGRAPGRPRPVPHLPRAGDGRGRGTRGWAGSGTRAPATRCQH